MKRYAPFHKTLAILLALGFLFSPSITFAESAGKDPEQKRTSPQKRKFTLHNFSYGPETSVETLIRSIAELERINVIFDNTVARQVETSKTPFMAKDISVPSALEIIFNTNRLAHVVVDKRTIIVFQDALANRQRFDDLFIRIFYLKDVPLEEARTAIQIGFSGKQIQISPLKDLNALLIRDTEENLKLMETLLTRIDRPKTEFVMDVNLYEVSDQTALQLSNQSGALSPNGSSLLQNRASSRLIGSTKLHAIENQPAELHLGQRVPTLIKTRRTPVQTPSTPATEQPKQPSEQPSSVEEEQYQFVDVGLSIQLTPNISDDYIKISITVDMSGATKTVPSVEFNQYRVKDLITIKKDETKIVANTFPLVGDFFAPTSQKSSNTNIIVTITPHVTRSPEVTPLDRSLLGPNGTVTGPDAGITLEEMLIRAEQEEGQQK